MSTPLPSLEKCKVHFLKLPSEEAVEKSVRSYRARIREQIKDMAARMIANTLGCRML